MLTVDATRRVSEEMVRGERQALVGATPTSRLFDSCRFPHARLMSSSRIMMLCTLCHDQKINYGTCGVPPQSHFCFAFVFAESVISPHAGILFEDLGSRSLGICCLNLKPSPGVHSRLGGLQPCAAASAPRNSVVPWLLGDFPFEVVHAPRPLDCRFHFHCISRWLKTRQACQAQ